MWSVKKKVSEFSLVSKIPYTVIIKLRLTAAMAKTVNFKLKFAELLPGFLTCGGRGFLLALPKFLFLQNSRA